MTPFAAFAVVAAEKALLNEEFDPYGGKEFQSFCQLNDATLYSTAGFLAEPSKAFTFEETATNTIHAKVGLVLANVLTANAAGVDRPFYPISCVSGYFPTFILQATLGVESWVETCTVHALGVACGTKMMNNCQGCTWKMDQYSQQIEMNNYYQAADVALQGTLFTRTPICLDYNMTTTKCFGGYGTGGSFVCHVCQSGWELNLTTSDPALRTCVKMPSSETC